MDVFHVSLIDERCSRMSRFALVCPPEPSADDGPRLLPFVILAPRLRAQRMTQTVARARLEHENQCCPLCRRVTVEPIELHDALRGRNGAAIPGTATVVAFACNACGHEWPA
jgi:hypothetical protein